MSPVPHWSANLEKPPLLVAIGNSTHGFPRRVERYYLLQLWCLHFYRYNADLSINGQWFSIEPGTVSLVPPRTHLEYRYRGASSHVFVHFQLEENGAHSLAAFYRAAQLDSTLGRGLDECVAWSSGQRRRAEARLWDILWRLELTPPDLPRHHPVVERAQTLIEGHLGEDLSVEALAREVGISHNQLTRLFRATCGQTVTGYIQTRRAERAAHLLRHTTLPAKAIGAQVGVKDLQALNKLVRRHTGASPRQVRNA
jgi:AraC-like DNA-binding protein